MPIIIQSGRFRSPIIDTFTRADSAVTMGSTETGQAWVTASTYGISSNQAYSPAVLFVSAFVNSGLADCTITVTITNGAAATSNALIFRGDGTDSNWMAFGANVGTPLIIYKKVAGSYTTLATGTTTFAASTSYTLQVILSGSSIVCKVNGATEPNCSITDSTHLTNTRHGFLLNKAGDRADNFSVV